MIARASVRFLFLTCLNCSSKLQFCCEVKLFWTGLPLPPPLCCEEGVGGCEGGRAADDGDDDDGVVTGGKARPAPPPCGGGGGICGGGATRGYKTSSRTLVGLPSLARL